MKLLFDSFRRKQTKKETIPYPICSVVAVFKMLIRILNTLQSRIWDRVLFLFSDYLNLRFNNMECARRLWFSLEWISLEEDTFLLDCIKIIFTYSYLMENFSLVSSHNLLENPLLFSTEITNLLSKPDSRWNKISCWIVSKLW